MPVDRIKELHRGRDFGSDTEQDEYTSVFMVFTTRRQDEGSVIADASQQFGLPEIGDKYAHDSEARCVSRSGSNTAGPFIWIITYGFTTDTEAFKDPREDEPDITWDDVFQSELTDIGTSITRDRSEVMTNSAFDTYDKPVSVQVGIKAATISFNLDGEDELPFWVFEFPSDPILGRYMINAGPILVDRHRMEKGTARFERAAVGEVRKRNKIKYREVVVRVAWNPNGWGIERIDEGYRAIHEGGPRAGKHRTMTEFFGAIPSKPLPLDGNGQQIDVPTRENIVLNKFNLYIEEPDFDKVKGIEEADPAPVVPGEEDD